VEQKATFPLLKKVEQKATFPLLKKVEQKATFKKVEQKFIHLKKGK
jgi:hypothetical protein